MTEPSAESPLEKYVVGAAADQLRDGKFVLATPEAVNGIPIISAERARALATAYLHTWGSTMIPLWAWERDVPLSSGAVAPGSRIFFAQTPYGRFPGDLYHPAFQRIYGPWYLVPLNAGDETVALLAVSAYSTDVTIDHDGRIRTPPLGGSYFVSKAVAPTPRLPKFHFVPVSPEEAVERVAKLTGASITEAPRLVLPNNGVHPALAHWRVALDRPVLVRRGVLFDRPGAALPDQTPIAVREVYAGPNGRLFIAKADQPAHIRVLYPTGPGSRDGPQPHAVHHLPRRPDTPVDFEPVTLVIEGR